MDINQLNKTFQTIQNQCFSSTGRSTRNAKGEQFLNQFISTVQTNPQAMSVFMTEAKNSGYIQEQKRMKSLNYSSKYIQQQNKKTYHTKRQNVHDNFIIFDRKDKKSFQDKVQMYLKKIKTDEKKEEEKIRKEKEKAERGWFDEPEENQEQEESEEESEQSEQIINLKRVSIKKKQNNKVSNFTDLKVRKIAPKFDKYGKPIRPDSVDRADEVGATFLPKIGPNGKQNVDMFDVSSKAPSRFRDKTPELVISRVMDVDSLNQTLPDIRPEASANASFRGRDSRMSGKIRESSAGKSQASKSKGSEKVAFLNSGVQIPGKDVSQQQVEMHSPSKFKKNQKGNESVLQGIQKQYYSKKLDREDHTLIDHFKKICNEQLDAQIRQVRLTKGKFKAFLSQRYKGKVAEKLIGIFDFTMPVDFNAFCDVIENLINVNKEKLKRLTFSAMDVNSDKKISESDLFSLMKLYEDDDERVFLSAFTNDFSRVVSIIMKKKELSGGLNDIQIKLNQISHNLEKRRINPDYNGEDFLQQMVGNVNSRDSSFDSDDELSAIKRTSSKITGGSSEVDKTSLRRKSTLRTNMTASRANLKSAARSRNSARSRAGSRMSKRTSASNGSRGNSQTRRSNSSRRRSSSVLQIQDEDEGDLGERLLKHIQKKITAMSNEICSWEEFNNSLNQDYVEYTQFSLDLIDYMSLFKIYDNQAIDKGELLEIQRLIGKEKNKLEEDEADNLSKNFKLLSRNPDAEKEAAIYINEESLKHNFVSIQSIIFQRKVFGYDSVFLAHRLYMFLSDGIEKQRIHMHQWFDKLHPLVDGTDIQKSDIIFKLYDWDKDNELGVIDLLKLKENISEYCPLYQEIKKFTNFYVENHILKKDKKSTAIDLKIFLEKIIRLDHGERSMMIDELRDRIVLSKQGSSCMTDHFDSSVKKKERLLVRKKKENLFNIMSLLREQKQVGFN